MSAAPPGGPAPAPRHCPTRRPRPGVRALVPGARRQRAAVSRLLLVLLIAGLAGGCAWTDPANRPLWNAFETQLVPEGDGAFYATLPLTVPAGLLAIVLDTFVVHPAQVADDAWGDAGDLWRELPWAEQYYTQLALLPFRAIGTPIVFVFSFLGRSCFDIEPRGQGQPTPDAAGRATEAPDTLPMPTAGAADARAAAREAELLAAFARVSGGATTAAGWEVDVPPPPWSLALQQAFELALARGSAPGRLALLSYVRWHALPPVLADPALGLTDPDPVLRYELLRQIRNAGAIPQEVRAALREDPNELVRALARELWL